MVTAGIMEYDPATTTYVLPPEHAAFLVGAGSMTPMARANTVLARHVPADRRLQEGRTRNDPGSCVSGCTLTCAGISATTTRRSGSAMRATGPGVIHSEKGDGALTRHERAVLEACDRVQVITVPGRSFFLPIEESATVARLITEALAPAR
jgi:Rv2258c-like winged HTH domain